MKQKKIKSIATTGSSDTFLELGVLFEDGSMALAYPDARGKLRFREVKTPELTEESVRFISDEICSLDILEVAFYKKGDKPEETVVLMKSGRSVSIKISYEKFNKNFKSFHYGQ